MINTGFQERKRIIAGMVICALGSLCLMFIAIVNGYPLVEGDTGSYIFHGFHAVLPADRSVFYCLFVRFSSFGISLWFTIGAQALIVSGALLCYAGLFFKEDLSLKSITVCIIGITTFTPVSWVTDFVMADIFTAILLLATLLFLFDEKQNKVLRSLYAITIIAATLIHNSHFVILFLFSLIIVLYSLISRRKYFLRRSVLLVCLSASCWLIMCSMHYVRGHGFTFSRGSHVFIVTKLAESGILKIYLDDNCAEHNYRLCAYKGELPAASWDFMWNNNSPLYKTGGWDSSKEEYDSIIRGVFTTPKYAGMFARASFTATCRQLTQIKTEDKIRGFENNAAPSLAIQQYFPKELEAYQTARQNTSGFGSRALSLFYVWCFVVSSVIAFIIIKNEEDKRRIYILYTFIILFIVVNAFITATLSTVSARLQYRVFWVLPATNIIVAARFIVMKKNNTEKGNLKKT